MTSFSKKEFDLVRKTTLMHGAPDTAVRQLVESSTVETHSDGEILFLQGEDADAFYIILEGAVKVSRILGEGRATILNIFGAGDTFAEAAVFDAGDYPATAEVVSNARLIRVSRQSLLDTLRKEPEFAISLFNALSHRLRFMVEQLEQQRAIPAPQRLALYLIDSIEEMDGAAEFQFPYGKHLLAGKLGMNPETFSRALAKLRPVGVSTEHDTVTIVSMSNLRRFAGVTDN